jgi:glycosyltransferase involved in cell wall biosynthesis
MGNTKVLCILTTLLGNKATTQRLIQTLDRMEGVSPTYVLIGAEDYARYPAPRLARATDAWEGRYIARKKAKPVLSKDFDLLLVNSWEFVTEFRNVARKVPAAVLMDAVPFTVNAQLRRRGQTGWKRFISHRLNHGPFRSAVPNFQAFLPMGSDCADALEREYGVNRKHCYITLAPQDLELWKPGAGEHCPPPLRLLFVGNDFVRKGGDFLLRLYTQYLSEFCTLAIASNDSALEQYTLAPGVEWLRGRNREQLLQVYRSSDLFVFPTQQDYMPQVLCEALATGVPCMANDVGGIRDLVHDGETGFLMSCEDSAERWAERLRFLNSHPEEIRRMSASARSFAERNLDLTGFEKLVTQIIDRLRSGQNQ